MEELNILFWIGALIFGIFQIALMIRMWKMCNNIAKLTDKFCHVEEKTSEETNEGIKETNKAKIKTEEKSFTYFDFVLLGVIITIVLLILIFG